MHSELSYSQASIHLNVWIGGQVVRMLNICDQQVAGSNPGLECNPKQVASVTKQYNLVPANGQ